ncbi:hypothetical protein TNCV_4414321 [Trichonephila clavipes]|uniref:Uncharacterized protein n=1 Tax=Trichonephila clavipes TaxID=2585209 RepID=A0A8X6VED2_TRICX|nr:hypothetical protein TNCV_4414321 [Trichonephila clavipes]
MVLKQEEGAVFVFTLKTKCRRTQLIRASRDKTSLSKLPQWEASTPFMCSRPNARRPQDQIDPRVSKGHIPLPKS